MGFPGGGAAAEPVLKSRLKVLFLRFLPKAPNTTRGKNIPGGGR
jgi:hypothetical protein